MSSKLVRSRPEACLSDRRLDELALSEIAEADERAAREHLATCEACAGRAAALGAHRASAVLPERAFAGRGATLKKPTPRRERSYLRVLAGPAAALLASAALVALLVRPSRNGDTPASPPWEVRAKGGDSVGFFVKPKGKEARLGSPGEHVAPGDQLRFTYSRAQAGYLAIVSVDAQKRATVYFPAGPRATYVQPGHDVPLASAIELDEVFGDEVVWGIFCDDAIDLEPLRVALETNPSAPKLPASCTSSRTTITKEAPR